VGKDGRSLWFYPGPEEGRQKTARIELVAGRVTVIKVVELIRHDIMSHGPRCPTNILKEVISLLNQAKFGKSINLHGVSIQVCEIVGHISCQWQVSLHFVFKGWLPLPFI
jgi:hypothetical protein